MGGHKRVQEERIGEKEGRNHGTGHETAGHHSPVVLAKGNSRSSPSPLHPLDW